MRKPYHEPWSDARQEEYERRMLELEERYSDLDDFKLSMLAAFSMDAELPDVPSPLLELMRA